MVPTPYVMSPPFWGKGWEFNEVVARGFSPKSDLGEAKEMAVERRISIGPVAMEARKGIHQYQQQQQQQQHHHHHHQHHGHNGHGGALYSSDGGVTCMTCIDVCRLAIFARILRLSSE